uniref:YchJ-like middle NTF2-like domain-containing protein n=1 Tax=Minutocellus polymorphus TaxID=265543 RepID=A0A7S0AHI5_9STRA
MLHLLILACFVCRLPLASSFAAKKASKGRQAASTRKGFGAPPPTFEQVASGLKNRLPEAASSEACPCGSGQKYGDCCQPFHLGSKWPQSPREVLQTRYSAFAYRLPAYIIDTTHPECRDWRPNKVDWIKDLDRQGMFDSYEFVSLEPGEEEAGSDDNEGYITFKVQLKAKGTGAGGESIEGQEMILSERSKFLNDGEPLCWRYASGEVKSDVSGLDDVVLNR